MEGQKPVSWWFAVLGVEEGVSYDEIEIAYRKRKEKLTSTPFNDTRLAELARRRLEDVEEAYRALVSSFNHRRVNLNGGNCTFGYRPGYYYRRHADCCPDCGDLCTACACIWAMDTCCECAGGDCI